MFYPVQLLELQVLSSHILQMGGWIASLGFMSMAATWMLLYEQKRGPAFDEKICSSSSGMDDSEVLQSLWRR